MPKINMKKKEVVNREHLFIETKIHHFQSGIRLLISLMNIKERRTCLALVASMSVNAALSFIAISSLMPFIYLIISDEPFSGNSKTSSIFRFLKFHEINTALFSMGLAVIALTIIKILYEIFHTYTVDKFTSNLERRLATDILQLIIKAPYQWLSTQNNIVLKEIAVARSGEWARGSVRTLLQLGGDFLFLIFTLSALVFVNPKEGVCLIVGGGLISYILVTKSKPYLRRYSEEKRRFGRIALLNATDSIIGGRDIRLSNCGQMLVDAFFSAQNKFSNAEIKSRLVGGMPRRILETLSVSALVIFGLSMLIMGTPKNEASAILILYALLFTRALPIISQSVGTINLLYTHFPSIGELHEFVNKIQQQVPKFQNLPTISLSNWNRMELENVNFFYQNSKKPAVCDANLTISKGQKIGLVGKSGSGKSTLIDLVAGLLQPTSGTVRINNQILTKEFQSEWQAQIAYVSQSPFIVDGTILDNVLLGSQPLDSSEKRCLDSLCSAGLKELIDTLPDGIHSRCGDNGSKLSGGQRQRIAIARALYRKASLLILDEATSALDGITEQAIAQEIFDIPEISLIIITHRLSLVQKCDQVLVIDSGRIVSSGSHANLMEASTYYQKLAAAQKING